MKKLMIAASAAILLASCGAAEDAVKDAGDAVKDAGAKTVEVAKDAGAATKDAVKDAGAATAEAAGKVKDYVADKMPGKLADAAKGTYNIEKTHAFLTASVGHGGLSDYRMDFTDFDATMNFDPNDASATTIEFSVNPASVTTHYPGNYKAGHADSPYNTWDEEIARSAKFFNSDKFPKAMFKSTKTRRTGPYSAKVTGDLTFLGVSKPVTFDVTYNGVGNKPWYGEMDLIGFNADATISRSEFGLTALKNGIGDEVTISFSGEFLQVQ